MTEDQLEQEALGWLRDVGYTLLNGYEIVVDGTTLERPDYKNTLILFRLLETINRLNSIIPLPSNFENSILGEIPSC